MVRDGNFLLELLGFWKNRVVKYACTYVDLKVLSVGLSCVVFDGSCHIQRAVTKLLLSENTPKISFGSQKEQPRTHISNTHHCQELFCIS
jgi:hypothetical protein